MTAGHGTDPATEAFVAHRNLLFTVAHEMLASAADAEDVFQETWLRWVRVPLERVDDPRACLVRVTTRQALNRLRTLRRREAYVGQWLPEPLLMAPGVADDIELAESMSMAMMLALENLAPTDWAVFALCEVFEVEYEEIAAAVGKTPAAVCQIAHRARERVGDRRPPGGPPPRARRGRPSIPSGAPSRPATRRPSSTCSPRTWSCSATAAASNRPRCTRSSAPTS
ncbi:hypothetical protein GCM10017562_59210 [Streptomyces roseofulvus]